MPGEPFDTRSAAALLAGAEAHGMDTLLDGNVLDLLAGASLSGRVRALVTRLAITQGCGTLRTLLSASKVWNALGPAITGEVLDALGAELTARVTPESAALAAAGGPPPAPTVTVTPVDPPRAAWRDRDAPGADPEPPRRARPAAPAPSPTAATDGPPTLAPGMPEADLRAWAAAHEVTADLDKSARVLDDRVSGRARYWFWQGSDQKILDVVITRRSRLALGGMPQEVQEAAITWLEERVVRMQRAQADERTLLTTGAPPEEPLLRALWDRVEAARAVVRILATPTPAGELVRMQVHTGDDPPTWSLRDGWPALCGSAAGGATKTVQLQASSDADFLSCDCARLDPRCPLALVALDRLRLTMARPSAERKWLLDTLGTPAWARVLHDLDALLATTKPEADDLSLGWRVDLDAGTLLPVACRPKKRGGGWKIAKMTLDELRERPERCALPSDHEVRALVLAERPDVQRSGQAVFSTLARLVGHPRVFVGTELVTVRRGVVETDWSPTEDGGVRLGVTVGGRERDARALHAAVSAAGRGGWYAVQDDTVVTVFPIDAQTLGLLGTLVRRGNIFPAEATAGLLARLAPLSQVVPARVAAELRGAERPAEETPIVRLDTLAEGGLFVQVLVRPLAGGLAFTPGEGPAQLHAELPEGRVHVARDLPAEPARVRAALTTIPLPSELEAPPFSWMLTDGDTALDVISALQAGAFAVEWADPERRRATRQADAKNLTVRVKSKRDWFGVEGEVSVGEASVELAAVLAAVLAGRRYVAVDGDTWIRLGDRLSEQLSGVAEAVHGGRAGLEVPALAAPLVDALKEAGATLDTPAGWADVLDRVRAADGYAPELPAGFTAELRAYQLAGFQWLARLATWAPGACLADDMGLGKTVQALTLLAHRAELGPALVVAPTSVGFNWVREAARFAPNLRVRAYRGAARQALLPTLAPGDLLVTSWDLLPRDGDALAAVPFATLVLDEAQAMKNAGTARAKAAAALNAGFRVALTGTPVENRVGELWSLFRVIAPGLLGSWERFRDRFATAIERDGDTRRRAALAKLIRPFLLRRLKSEVATELPQRSDVNVEIVLSREERLLYDHARAALLDDLSAESGPPEQQRFKVLAALTRLRQLACHPRLLDPTSVLPSAKLTRLRELVAELRENGHRALIFSQFTKHLALVREALEADGVPLRYLDGSTPESQRRAEVDAFQAGRGDVFLISLKAGGVGLNLTAATYVLHLDPWWNPAVEDQASDRAHRIGQTQPVTVYRLVARGTIEEQILALHGEKRELVAGLLDGTGAAAAMKTDELLALLQAGEADEVEEGVADAGEA